MLFDRLIDSYGNRLEPVFVSSDGLHRVYRLPAPGLAVGTPGEVRAGGPWRRRLCDGHEIGWMDDRDVITLVGGAMEGVSDRSRCGQGGGRCHGPSGWPQVGATTRSESVDRR